MLLIGKIQCAQKSQVKMIKNYKRHTSKIMWIFRRKITFGWGRQERHYGGTDI